MTALDLPISMLERPLQDKLTFIDTRSRNTDGGTSREAAKAAVSRKADRERAAITATVKTFTDGMTAREVADWTGIDYIEVQRRISECGLTKTDRRRDGCFVWSANSA